MKNPSSLVDALIFKSALILRCNQDDNAGVIDYERFQSEMEVILTEVKYLEEERNMCVEALKFNATELRENQEQIRSLQSLCEDYRKRQLNIYSFCDDYPN